MEGLVQITATWKEKRNVPTAVIMDGIMEGFILLFGQFPFIIFFLEKLPNFYLIYSLS